MAKPYGVCSTVTRIPYSSLYPAASHCRSQQCLRTGLSMCTVCICWSCCMAGRWSEFSIHLGPSVFTATLRHSSFPTVRCIAAHTPSFYVILESCGHRTLCLARQCVVKFMDSCSKFTPTCEYDFSQRNSLFQCLQPSYCHVMCHTDLTSVHV